MNKVKLLILFVCTISLADLYAQSPTSPSCGGAVGVCSSTSYSFPAGVGAGSAAPGPNYGCLTTTPNPAWFFIQIQNSGSITFKMTSSPARDIDYIVWGPFTDPFSSCGASLTAAKRVSCSYANSTTETAIIPNGQTGEYYILLITNYSNSTTNISFSQTSGSGSSNCDILCNITGLTATASACQSGADLGKYTVSGTVSTFSPPSSGTLTVSSSSGASVTYNAPFTTSMNYTLPGVAGHADTCTITAVFSKVSSTCFKTTTVVTPRCCTVSATASSVTLCASKTLTLGATGTSGGTYHWSGPSGFSSTNQNPSLPNILSPNAGTYQVYLVNGACTTPSENVSVTVNPKPTVKNIVHQ
jgi:hypothetical protein